MKTRSATWAKGLALALVRARVPANAVSVGGLGCAALGSACFLLVAHRSAPARPALFGAAVGVQLRLLCNMLDGLVAVEGGLKGKGGALFNELPDRIEDVALLVSAGHAAGRPELGWLCAALALLAAYLRALGGALQQPQDLRGPGAKQHRMFLLTVGGLAAMACFPALTWTLWLTAAATLLTCVRRAVLLYRRLP